MRIAAKILLDEVVGSLTDIYDKPESAAIGKVVLEDLLDVPAHQLPLNPTLDLTESQQQVLDDAITRLRQYEPVQYVTGRCYFYGRRFTVSRDVLIPRPETEELVALIIRQQQGRSALKVADIGTGSGCIAVTLAAELRQSEVTAIDISPKALAVALENAQLNAVALKTELLDICSESLADAAYDLIVSNPPYITLSERRLMHDNVLAHEPGQALFVPDEDPLRFYTHIAEQGLHALRDGGSVYCEINEHFGADTVALFKKHNYQNVELHRDMQGKDRMVSCRLA